MQNTGEPIDIYLLRSDRDEFIVRCQRIITIVVKYFIKSGMFEPAQYDDAMQSINEEFIKRLPSIEKNFDHRVRMSTYVSVIIRNICLRIYEREQSDMSTVSLSTIDLPYDEGNSASLILDDELERLKLALSMYGAQQYKLILCLKVYFRLPVSMTDLRQCFKKSNGTELHTLYSAFGSDYDHSRESDNFSALSPFMNKEEENLTSGDSLRRWTVEHLVKLIALLNGDPPNRSHTKETIKILLDQYSQ